jgi:hypothetical protein
VRAVLPGFFVARVDSNQRNEAVMNYWHECYRRPYRRGDYDLVDTTRAGTYWRSPEGVVVRLASAAGERMPACERPAVWSIASALLARRLAGP